MTIITGLLFQSYILSDRMKNNYVKTALIFILSLTAFFIMIFSTANTITDNNDLQIKLLLVKRETSKDSHSEKYDIMINARDVKYSHVHYGHPAPFNITENFTLTENLYGELIDYIKNSGLNTNSNIREIQSTKGYGISVSANLELISGDNTTRIEIAGMSKRWNSGKEKRCNIQKIELYHRVRGILSIIQKQVKPNE